MRRKNFFIPLPTSYSNFTLLKRSRKANKGRKTKIPTNLRLFLKNAPEGILEPFLRPPKERNEKAAFFLSPSRAFRPCLAIQKTQGNLLAQARTSRVLVVFFLATAFFGRAAPGERKKRSPTLLAASFLFQCRLDYLWQSVRENLRKIPGRFFQHLINA